MYIFHFQFVLFQVFYVSACLFWLKYSHWKQSEQLPYLNNKGRCGRGQWPQWPQIIFMAFSLCWQNQQCESKSHEYNSEYMPMAAVNAAKTPRIWGISCLWHGNSDIRGFQLLEPGQREISISSPFPASLRSHDGPVLSHETPTLVLFWAVWSRLVCLEQNWLIAWSTDLYMKR